MILNTLGPYPAKFTKYLFKGHQQQSNRQSSPEPGGVHLHLLVHPRISPKVTWWSPYLVQPGVHSQVTLRSLYLVHPGVPTLRLTGGVNLNILFHPILFNSFY